MTAEKPREIAAQILQRHAEGREYVERLLDGALAHTTLAPVDRGLVQELTFGVVRWQATLDWLIARKTAGRTQKLMLQILLRLGLYQLFWLARIPDHAAVHETVELARVLGLGPQAGFLNAVLRGYLREREQTRRMLDELKATQPALGYSHLEWLCERWEKRWGTEALRQLLEWNNTPPVTYARVNALKTDAVKLTAQWDREGVQFVRFPRPRSSSSGCEVEGRARHSARAVFTRDQGRRAQSDAPYLPGSRTSDEHEDEGREREPQDFFGVLEQRVFALKSHPSLASLPSFQQGCFYVQDPSTLLAVHELNPQPGETVLDLCAAPGGKTTYIAQLMQNRGRIVAQDSHPQRLNLLRENCTRLGVTSAEFSTPTTIVFPELSMALDRVLVDAPCSNTGVMRRRVDLRWRIRPEEIDRLSKTQLSLLRDAAVQVKPGGTLVYSTCSLEPEENGEVIQKFLIDHPDFKLECERQLLPFLAGVDGAYVARLTRAAS